METKRSPSGWNSHVNTSPWWPSKCIIGANKLEVRLTPWNRSKYKFPVLETQKKEVMFLHTTSNRALSLLVYAESSWRVRLTSGTSAKLSAVLLRAIVNKSCWYEMQFVPETYCWCFFYRFSSSSICKRSLGIRMKVDSSYNFQLSTSIENIYLWTSMRYVNRCTRV